MNIVSIFLAMVKICVRGECLVTLFYGMTLPMFADKILHCARGDNFVNKQSLPAIHLDGMDFWCRNSKVQHVLIATIAINPEDG